MTEKPESGSHLTEAEMDALVAQARRPALLLNKTKFPDDPGEPGCWLGGAPTLPPEIDWPYHEVEGIQSPLVFIVQINLARVPRSEHFPALPESGTLFFFFDPHFATFDAKVIYVEGDVSALPAREVPDLPGPNRFMLDRHIRSATEANPLKRWNFDFFDFATYPSHGPMEHALFKRILQASRSEIDAAGRANAKRWSGSGRGSSMYFSMHFMFGSEDELAPPSGDPALLLTTKSDADVGIASSTHYLFWIPADALAALDFHGAFLTKE